MIENSFWFSGAQKYCTDTVSDEALPEKECNRTPAPVSTVVVAERSESERGSAIKRKRVSGAEEVLNGDTEDEPHQRKRRSARPKSY